MSKKRKVFIVIAVVLALLNALLIAAAVRLSPTVEAMAGAQAEREAVRIINESVLQLVERDGLDYSALVVEKRSADGRIVSLQCDMDKVNRFKSELTELIADRLDNIDAESISVPLGNALGSFITSGRGPDIPVRIVSVGSVVSTLDNDFTAVGINQTRHRILLSVGLTFTLAFPGGSGEVAVEDTVCIAETIIAGEIPERYAVF